MSLASPSVVRPASTVTPPDTSTAELLSVSAAVDAVSVTCAEAMLIAPPTPIENEVTNWSTVAWFSPRARTVRLAGFVDVVRMSPPQDASGGVALDRRPGGAGDARGRHGHADAEDQATARDVGVRDRVVLRLRVELDLAAARDLLVVVPVHGLRLDGGAAPDLGELEARAEATEHRGRDREGARVGKVPALRLHEHAARAGHVAIELGAQPA